MALTTDKKARKNAPMDRGLLAYFPNALAGVAELSRIGNEQHNPGEEMHWARDKSNDHGDCIIRHQADWDQLDEDGMPHCAKVAWRALAQYEEYLIARGATPGRGTRTSQDSDGWIEWHGGDNPVGSLHVEVRLRSGRKATESGHYWNWRHESFPHHPGDIMAYRVVDGEG